ncbi:GNAT family N-acetyltransferase [Actinoplanes sp. NPDC051633]|uniref:GNAT family N-acetyltransferase n=1 Tax=Actinoplanes sp. NPDC051633 TaxID=3155670 RepID=UPI003432B567
MTVRPATMDDAAALAAVQVATWQVAYRGQVPQEHLDRMDPARREPGWRQWIRDARPPAGILVLDDEEHGVIGFNCFAPTRDQDDDPATVGEVQAIYLLPSRWGTGGGRLLMAAGVRRLTEAGFRELTLWVLDTNAQARRFYEAAGWGPDGASKVDDSRGFPMREVRYRRTLP